MNRIILSVFIITILICSISISFSQQKGNLNGEVIDRNTQSLLEGITVRLLNTDLGTVTGKNGGFEITGIPAGTYEVKFSDIAYETYIESNVVIAPGKTVVLQAELQNITTDEVVVESSRYQKPPDVTTSYKSLTFEELRRAPGGFEDIGRVIQTLPGVALGSDGRNDINVRGGSPSENLFIVDGFPVNNISEPRVLPGDR